MNRRLISRLTTYHFAPTPRNRDTLLSEGVVPEAIFVTGNPVVDSLTVVLQRSRPGPVVEEAIHVTQGLRRIVLTTHRRESFGEVMLENLRVLRRFVERHDDVSLLFPVHPNPAVVSQATAILSGHARIHRLPPLDYESFILLLSQAWLIVSDSGGVQEEAPTLGRPLLILRENTERPESIECGVARLVGGRPERLAAMLDEISRDRSWIDRVGATENPFGDGHSGRRIAQIIARVLHVSPADHALTGGRR
jgi:UDP-N-acetylglucosamine 2-epimerase (non-hydrolysing)